MAVKIRLRQQGRNNCATYRLVVTDARTRRDGKYQESLGWYNPAGVEDKDNVSVDAARVQFWLDQGAELSDRARDLLKRAAPEVIQKLVDKTQAHRVKVAAKRREQRKKQAA